MKTLWNQFADSHLKHSEEIFKWLKKLYSEKHRHYHNLGHIKFLLALFREFENEIEDKPAIFFAIWFHDAIYDPQRKDNEKRSAKLAVENLRKLSLPEEKISKIKKIILATAKHSAENPDDGKIFLDFDLAILGAGKEIYDKYKNAVRAEYNFVDEEIYRTERKRVLQNFLLRDFIYFTMTMRERLEEKARRNIEREVLEL